MKVSNCCWAADRAIHYNGPNYSDVTICICPDCKKQPCEFVDEESDKPEKKEK